MSFRISTPLLALVLSGCAANGTGYADHLQAIGPAKPDSSRVIAFRAGESLQGAGGLVYLRANDKEIGAVGHKGFNVFELSPGSTQLLIQTPMAMGSCQLTTELQAGQTYYFEIAPRSNSIKAATVGVLLGGIVGAMIASGIESAGKTCGGPTSIVEATPDRVSDILPQLKFTVAEPNEPAKVRREP